MTQTILTYRHLGKGLSIVIMVLVAHAVFGFNTTVEQTSVYWKAGVSKRVITPKETMWLGGYASRTKPSTGEIHDLWAKAIVLEDVQKNRVVLVSADILGFEKNMADSIARGIGLRHGLPRANLLLNGSHTHSGPVLWQSLQDIYPLDEEESNKVREYTDWLVQEIISLVDDAMANLDEATVFSGNGFARIQVNRRENDEADLFTLSELIGPQDYSVPIIHVVGADKQVKAVLFGLACHPTVLSGYEWSGDYAGFAQLEIEAQYPGAQAMFFQGAGGEQNPMPRRTVALAERHGKTLAAAVKQVIVDGGLKPLAPSISAAYKEISLPFQTGTDRATLRKVLDDKSSPQYFVQWAKRLMEKLDVGEQLDVAYNHYPVQCLRLGEQVIFSLGGEVVVEYALNIKGVFGHDTFVFGYCNDLMGYIPTERILEEGGYEGDDAQKVYGLPAKWAPGIERRILMACAEVYNTLIGMN